MDSKLENSEANGPVGFLSSFAHLLSPEDIELLEGSSNRVEYGKRDIVVKQGTRSLHIPYVLSGLVKVSREMRKDKTIILRLEKPFNFVGISSVFGSDTFDYSAIALEPTSVLLIDAQAFAKVLERNGPFAYEIVQGLSRRNIFNVSRLTSLLYKQLPGRVADIILYFSEEIYGQSTFSFPLTRQELAELAGTTKESLIRTLSEFKNDLIIEINKNAVTITSEHIIRTLSRLG